MVHDLTLKSRPSTEVLSTSSNKSSREGDMIVAIPEHGGAGVQCVAESN